MDDPPLAEVVASIERPAPVALTILSPPRGAVDLADRAHGVQGFAGDGVHTFSRLIISVRTYPAGRRPSAEISPRLHPEFAGDAASQPLAHSHRRSLRIHGEAPDEASAHLLIFVH